MPDSGTRGSTGAAKLPSGPTLFRFHILEEPRFFVVTPPSPKWKDRADPALDPRCPCDSSLDHQRFTCSCQSDWFIALVPAWPVRATDSALGLVWNLSFAKVSHC